jgi:hypothetical protein
VIDRRLIIERAIAERRIEVTSDEVARARDSFAQEAGDLDEWLEREGLTLGELDAQLRRIIAFGKLKDLVVGDRVERVLPPHADGRARAALHHQIFECWLDRR